MQAYTKEALAERIQAIDLSAKPPKSLVDEASKPLTEAEEIAQSKRIEAVFKDVIAVLQEHDITPVEAYMACASLADGLYATMIEYYLNPND